MADAEEGSSDSPANLEMGTSADDSSNSSLKGGETTRSSVNLLPASSNPFVTQSSILGSKLSLKSSILRPSQLSCKADGLSEASKSSFLLSPSKLSTLIKANSNSGTEKENNADTKCSQALDPPKFVPLGGAECGKGSNAAVSVTSMLTPPSSNYIFGQNLQDRVVAEGNGAELNDSTASTSASTNGSSEMLFSSAVKKDASNEAGKSSKSLSESAREYLESRTNKRKYEEVQVVTGEEDETNILQVNCKIFTFDKKSGNWQERGRGTLRLNDKTVTGEDGDYCQSRLVIRANGSLRVVLNTKIWAGMTTDLASEKSIRLTGMDNNGEVKVFLIMANTEEIKQLHRSLKIRVDNEIRRQNRKKASASSASSLPQEPSESKESTTE